jgi:hypothetical protein
MELCKSCEICGAKWLGGTLYWSTGKPGLERDLASLVCQVAKNPKCINPQKDKTGGQTWEDRMRFLEVFEQEFKERMAE